MAKNEIQRASNPLAQTNNFAAATQENTMGAVASAGEIALVQARLVVAAQIGRNPRAAIDNILEEFTIPELAAVSLYQYAKGGSNITGLSIRAAEAIAVTWGHLDYGVRIIEQKRDETTAEAYALDLVTNVSRKISFRVPHYRDTRAGRIKLEDSREIYELVANNGSRRVRACLLAVIPWHVQAAVKKQIENTMAAAFDITPALLEEWLAAFETVGVTKSMLEAYIQRDWDAITPNLLTGLITKYNAICDGIAKPSDFFAEPATPAGKKPATLADKAKAAAAVTDGKEPEQQKDGLL